MTSICAYRTISVFQSRFEKSVPFSDDLCYNSIRVHSHRNETHAFSAKFHTQPFLCEYTLKSETERQCCASLCGIVSTKVVFHEQIQKLVSNTLIFAIGSFGSKILLLLLTRLYTGNINPGDNSTKELLEQTANFLIPIITFPLRTLSSATASTRISTTGRSLPPPVSQRHLVSAFCCCSHPC